MSKVILMVHTGRCLWFFLAVATTSISTAPGLFANEEMVKSLVGTWDGTVAVRQSFRRLTIESVTRDGDQWVGRGRWSQRAGARGAPVDITIIDAGEIVNIAFKLDNGDSMALKGTGERELTGKFNHAVLRQRRFADASFKKVE